MRVRLSVLMVSTVALASCGGGDDSSAGGDSADSWCALAQRIEDSNDDVDAAFELGDEAIRAAFEEFGSLLDDAKSSAPDEIRTAVETSSEGVEKFADLLDEVDYDVSQLTEEAYAELDEMGDELDAATDQIEVYNLRECGIAPSSDSDDSASDEPSAEEPSADEVTEEPPLDDDAADDESIADEATFVGDPNSDWCVAARDLDVRSDALDDLDFTDPAAIEAAFTEMITLYEGAVGLAPPELEDAVELSFSEILEFEAALKTAGYDILNADLSALEDAGDAAQAANDEIDLYNEQVCGIAADDDDPINDLGADDGDGGFDPGAGTIREQTIAALVAQGFTEDESACIFDNFDFSDPDAVGDEGSLIAMFEMCGIDLARLAELGG